MAGLALISLIFCPILLALDKETTAEQMAVYVYFFLVITVALQIAEEIKDSWQAKRNGGLTAQVRQQETYQPAKNINPGQSYELFSRSHRINSAPNRNNPPRKMDI